MKHLNKNDRDDFFKYLNNSTFYNPHIMFISKKDIMEKYFNDVFPWLLECEKIFGLDNLKGYDQTRLYAYLSERYLSFWFKITFTASKISLILYLFFI